MSKHLSPEIRVPIEPGNPSVERIEEKCIKCGNCRDICRDYISVLGYYDLAHTDDTAVCIHCGQCANVCPTGAIRETPETAYVKAAIKDPTKVVIVSTSPSVRISLGEEFGMPDGSFVEGKMVALLRRLGADYVLDTNFGADLTIVEEASELVERITRRDPARPLPQFTSCCPAWVKFAEMYYPELLPHISTAKSPIGMQGPTIKTYFAKKMGIDPKSIVNVALTPCTAKKYEIRREEMHAAGRYLGIEDIRDMDYVITTRELAAWAKEEAIDFPSLADSSYDPLMGEASGAGVIFGNTGGVMEAALRTAYAYITKTPAPEKLYELTPVRGMDGFREASVKIGDMDVNVAVLYGTANVRKFLDRQRTNPKDYAFVEVMTCPGGCIGGGGQPKGTQEKGNALLKERIDGLYARDASMAPAKRASHENSEILALYQSFYGKPLSELAEKMLHTAYFDRSALLGEDAGKFQHYQDLHPGQDNTAGAAGQNTASGAAGMNAPAAGAAGDPAASAGVPGRILAHVRPENLNTVRVWKCTVCGEVHIGSEPPAECPVCHQGKDVFIEITGEVTLFRDGDGKKLWECDVCHYLTEGEQAPAECHLCHQDSSHFHQVIAWKCTICQEIVIATTPPAECPVCHQGSSVFSAL
jgi:iron-only hydrogenase group A